MSDDVTGTLEKPASSEKAVLKAHHKVERRKSFFSCSGSPKDRSWNGRKMSSLSLELAITLTMTCLFENKMVQSESTNSLTSCGWK